MLCPGTTQQVGERRTGVGGGRGTGGLAALRARQERRLRAEGGAVPGAHGRAAAAGAAATARRGRAGGAAAAARPGHAATACAAAAARRTLRHGTPASAPRLTHIPCRPLSVAPALNRARLRPPSPNIKDYSRSGDYILRWILVIGQ